MALQLRRGLTANLTTITPAIGELLYVTDYAATNVSPLYIGDGTTPGGRPAGVTSVNGLNGAVSLTTVNVPEGVGAGNRQYFTTDRAQDAAGALLQGGVLSNITISYNSTSNVITISNPSVIQSGSTNSLAYWASSGTTLSPSSSMTWNESSNLLQNINGTFQVVANNNSRSLIIADTYSDSALSNSISIKKGRGTNITPLKVVSGDSIGSISFQAYDGTDHTVSSAITSVVQATPTTGSGTVQSLLSFSITNAQNLFVTAARITTAGTWYVGPSLSTDAGTGATAVVQTVVGGTVGVYASSLRNYYSDTNGALLDFRKYRGTLAVPTTVAVGDSLGIISGKGYDGSSLPIGATISMVADNTISTGKVPGAIIFSTATSNGVLTQATKIDSTQTLTHNGNAIVNGNLTVNGTTVTINSSILNVEDTILNLGYLTSGVKSTTGIVGTITGTGPWTATITGMSSTIGLNVGEAITATNGTSTSLVGMASVGAGVFTITTPAITIAVGMRVVLTGSNTGTASNVTAGTYTITTVTSQTNFTISTLSTATAGTILTQTWAVSGGTLYGGSPSSVVIASIVSATSISYIVTGGTIPTAGTITNISGVGSTDVTANGSGISIYGTTNKTFTWASTTSAWTSSENVVLASGKKLALNGSVSGAVSFTATGAVGTQNYVLPTALPASSGYALASDTSGNLSWIAVNSSTISGAQLTNGATVSGGSLTFSGNISAAAWTTSGIRHVSVAATLTDTTSTGTVANAYTNNFGGNTIAASNAVTFTNYGTVFINDPTSGTNVTITNPYSLITAGNVKLGSTGTGTIAAVAATATTSSTAASVGYLGLPQSATNTSATLAIGDSGKHIYVNTASQTMTIPANGTVAYPIGTTLTFIAGPSATTVSIAITTDTMYLAGTGTTGTRTLAAHGMATAVKVAATTWYINGTGLT